MIQRRTSVGATLRALGILILIGAAVAAAGTYALVRRGISTRTDPTSIEVLAARALRRLATPSDLRARLNPIPISDAALTEGLEHFAAHCALCHANDGSGDTSLGRGLYPRAPDMRAEQTQSLSDGELFSIIENGVRLTGMPAWGTGTPEGERESWVLVHFIRRLPTLGAGDLDRMKTLNPRTPAEFREDQEIRRFLAGEPTGAAEPAAPGPAGHGH